jgi:Flp pilus assembly protein TadD
MKRAILSVTIVTFMLLLTLTFAPKAAAQFGDTLSGQVWDFEGKPWVGLTVNLQNQAGQNWTVKTDKDGKFEQLHLQPGIYTIELKDGDKHIFSTKYQLLADGGGPANINLKEIAAKQGVNVEEQRKKQEEVQKQFTGMKAHFDAGIAAMNEANGLHAQLQSTPADQRGPIQEKLTGLFQTATSEFQQAQLAAGEKNPNLPTIVANLGAAYEASGQYDKAVETFQKAVELKPTQANYLSALGTNLARTGKMDEAGAACDKAAALDPPNAGVCWRNVGIVLRNANKMKEATAPLQKATQIDPKNPDGWYLLATSLLASIETKQQGDKLIYNVPPGTAEAYQKCVDLAPNGPHAQECKDGLASLEALGQGVETKVSTRKKK